MKTNTFVFLLSVLFAISSLKNVWAGDDELFDFDNEFDPLSALEEDFDELEEFEAAKNKPHQCRVRHEHYPPNERCIKRHCLALCKSAGSTDAKCRKSHNDVKKACYCFKDCEKTDTPGKPDNGSSPPSSPPAVSPAPNASPVYPPAPSPTPVASPVYPPAPVASPASSPAPEPASPLDPPCDDDVPSHPKNPTSVGEFSDEDFDLIFS